LQQGERIPSDLARKALLMAAAVLGLYLLQHPYQGILQDTRLYTLMALNRLRPDLYANDLFLRFGSQDDYTLFSPFYAWVISLFGVEPAAGLLTFASAAAVLAAGWWLARACMPAPLALLAAGLLAAIPSDYCSGGGFAVLEGSLTPRPFAESLVLLALGAWLRERRMLAAACLAAALLIHPIMSFPGVALLLVLAWWLPHWRRLWPAALAVGLLAAMAVAGWLPLARWQFDEAWAQAIGHGQYLRLRNWAAHDWARVALVLATLASASLCLSGHARRLAAALVLTSGALLLLTWVGSDRLNIAIVVQGQAWRVMWLATAVALLLLPAIMVQCWNGPPSWRSGGLLLAAAWVIGATPLALTCAIPALLALACGARQPPRWLARLAPRAAGVLLGVVVVCTLAVTWTYVSASTLTPDMPAWMQRLRTACADGLLPTLALLCGWYAATRWHSPVAVAGTALAIAAGTIIAAVIALPGWVQGFYTRQTVQAFSAWRQLVPEGSDVLWSMRLRMGSDPAGAWLLLQRPSYLSSIQSTSGLFSREASMEVRRRVRTVPRQLPIEDPFDKIVIGDWTSGPACADLPVRYVVTEVRITDAREIPAPASLGPPFDRMKLYICP
jgi:hypothetical protein